MNTRIAPTAILPVHVILSLLTSLNLLICFFVIFLLDLHNFLKITIFILLDHIPHVYQVFIVGYYNKFLNDICFYPKSMLFYLLPTYTFTNFQSFYYKFIIVIIMYIRFECSLVFYHVLYSFSTFYNFYVYYTIDYLILFYFNLPIEC